jgi:hypothetical protein
VVSVMMGDVDAAGVGFAVGSKVSTHTDASVHTAFPQHLQCLNAIYSANR